jgi:hypothetical protein
MMCIEQSALRAISTRVSQGLAGTVDSMTPGGVYREDGHVLRAVRPLKLMDSATDPSIHPLVNALWPSLKLSFWGNSAVWSVCEQTFRSNLSPTFSAPK